MNKRQREKQDGSYTGLPRTEHQLGSAKKLRVSSRSRLRSSRREACTNNDVSSSYTSQGYGSKLLKGHSPICSTPRSSRKRLNTSRSDSETEIIWDANSPTAHLMRRSGRNGRSKAGEISEMIKCVNNQTETSPAHFPLLGLWTHRSPLHQHELNSASGSEKASGEESSTSKRPTHKKKKNSRLSLIQDELQKIANAIGMASKHETASSPDTVLNHEPVTGFITPPRHNRTEELTDAVDGELLDKETSSDHARCEPDKKLPQPELTLGTRPSCLQPDPTPLVGDQLNTRQFTSSQPPTDQSAAGQTSSGQPLVPCQVGASSPVICQSLTPNVDIMWDDDSYFEDEALLEQLTQTEAMEACRSQHGNVSTNKTSQDNLSHEVVHHPPAHSTDSLRQPLNLGVTKKMWTESDNKKGQQKSQTFPGTVPRPTGSNKSTAANQRSRFNAMNVVKDTCPNQGRKQAPLGKPVTVKPPQPAQVTPISNSTIVEQHRALPSYKTQKSLPAHQDSVGQHDGCSAKSNLAKPHTSSCQQLGPVANATGKSSNMLKPLSTACTPISNKLQLTVSNSMNASSSIQEGWDNTDLFESSLTDEMMMSLCVGIDFPQTNQPSQQTSRVQVSKPFMSTRTITTQSADKVIKTQSQQIQNTTRSSTITTNSRIGSSSTTTYKFRKPVKDLSIAVSNSTSTASASVGKCSTNTSFINQPFSSTTNTVLPVHARNIQPVNNTIRHQLIGVPKAAHQLPQSSRPGVPSLNTTRSAVPSGVSNDTRPSSTKDNPASFYSKPVNVNSTSLKTLTAQSTRSSQTKTTSSASTKPAVSSTSIGGSHKVCSQTEIERKRQQARARLQQHRAGSQQRMMQQY